MGESGFKPSCDIRPVLDDRDESFEGRCGEHQIFKIAPAAARRDP
jgi:hypothetical protein